MTLLMQLLKNLSFKLIILVSFCSSNLIFGQELNCIVQINYEQVNVNQAVFQDMQNAIAEFMNNQRWTTDNYKPEEKIKCNIYINISKAINATDFESTFSVQSSRPIYGTNYESTVFNFIDKNVNFNYQQDQPLYFVENNYTSNLTSVLAYYAYVILGHDYDSFASLGGTKFYDKAQEVVSYAQQAPNAYSTGWNIDDKKSRFELIQDLRNNQFSSYRKNLYLYHRTSMDEFQKNQNSVRSNIMKILQDNQKIYDLNANSILLRVFFRAKSQELISIFSKGSTTEKQNFIKLVEVLDPSNLAKYQKINQ